MLGRGPGGDLGRLGVPGVVLPQPGHGVGIAFEFSLEAERRPGRVHGNGRRAGRVHADPDDLPRIEVSDGLAGAGQSLPDGCFDALEVIAGILTRHVRLALVEDDPGLSRRIGIDVSGQFAAVADVNEQGPDGVRPEVESKGVLGVSACFLPVSG